MDMSRVGYMTTKEYIELRKLRNKTRDIPSSKVAERWRLAQVRDYDRRLESHERKFPQDILEYEKEI